MNKEESSRQWPFERPGKNLDMHEFFHPLSPAKVRRRHEMSCPQDWSQRTSSFLFAQPSSKAGNSIPFSKLKARRAPAGSSYSAKPNPWGLFAGVISRLKDLMGPQA